MPKKGRGNENKKGGKGGQGGSSKKDAGGNSKAAVIPPTTTTTRQTRSSIDGKRPDQDKQDKPEPKSKKARLNVENGNLKANLDTLQAENNELQEKINKLQTANEEFSGKISKKNKYIKHLIDKNKSCKDSLKVTKELLETERKKMCATCRARELGASSAPPAAASAAVLSAQQPGWYQMPCPNQNWQGGYVSRGRGGGPYWLQQ